MDNNDNHSGPILRKKISTQDVRIMFEDNIMATKYNMSMTQETKQGSFMLSFARIAVWH